MNFTCPLFHLDAPCFRYQTHRLQVPPSGGPGPCSFLLRPGVVCFNDGARTALDYCRHRDIDNTANETLTIFTFEVAVGERERVVERERAQ